jgi:tetratricopeptide (TPR) repeat protein
VTGREETGHHPPWRARTPSTGRILFEHQNPTRSQRFGLRPPTPDEFSRLATKITVRGEDHPEVAASLTNLAELYREQGRHDEAEPLYQRALTIQARLLGDEHPATATVLNDLGSLYTAQRRYAEAEPFFRRALTIREKTLGPDHPYVATTLENLGGLYLALGRHTEAEPLLRRARGIRDEAPPGVHR